jgi:hypothetical protein
VLYSVPVYTHTRGRCILSLQIHPYAFTIIPLPEQLKLSYI